MNERTNEYKPGCFGEFTGGCSVADVVDFADPDVAFVGQKSHKPFLASFTLMSSSPISP